MRCAILLTSLKLGGAERVAVNLANGLQRNGCDIDLVLADCAGELLDEIDAKVRIVDLGAGRGRRAIFAFRRYVRSHRPDLVMPITFEMNLVATVALLRLKRRPKLLITVHGPVRRYDQAGPFYRRFAMALSRALYPSADLVITVSRGIADELVARKWTTPERVHTVYNPIITDEMTAMASEAPPKLDMDASVPIIVNVGRLVPAKDQLLLIDAFSLVLQKRAAQLWIVGEGPCRAELEQRIEELELLGSVHLLGHVSNPLPIVAAADLFVLSSAVEGFGNVLVEAMLVGTPIVSTDCPHGPREVLEGGKWGMLVPPGDAKALAKGILEALDSGGIDARERANDFTVKRAVEQYLELIRATVGEGLHV